jgi:hypothetical protein
VTGHRAAIVSGSAACTTGTLLGLTSSCTMPIPLRIAPRAASIGAPAMPSPPPTIARRRRTPL